jgi:hypothetical protein
MEMYKWMMLGILSNLVWYLKIFGICQLKMPLRLKRRNIKDIKQILECFEVGNVKKVKFEGSDPFTGVAWRNLMQSISNKIPGYGFIFAVGST